MSKNTGGDNMNFFPAKEPSFEDAQKLSLFYNTIESKTVLYNKLSKIVDLDYINSLDGLNIHEIYNYILLRYYPNETSIKSSFTNRVLMNGKNHVSIFELPIINSRADLCKINGESIVYEIKTELDNFSRLSKQISDYRKIFEKVYVICPVSKINPLKELITEQTGIYTYRITKKGNYIYKLERPAILNRNINSIEQLKILRKNELKSLIDNSHTMSREEMIDYLLLSKTSNDINILFKQSLKSRYKMQWNFLKNNHNKILEIDYQWFYKNTVDPKLIYN